MKPIYFIYLFLRSPNVVTFNFQKKKFEPCQYENIGLPQYWVGLQEPLINIFSASNQNV